MSHTMIYTVTRASREGAPPPRPESATETFQSWDSSQIPIDSFRPRFSLGHFCVARRGNVAGLRVGSYLPRWSVPPLSAQRSATFLVSSWPPAPRKVGSIDRKEETVFHDSSSPYHPCSAVIRGDIADDNGDALVTLWIVCRVG